MGELPDLLDFLFKRRLLSIRDTYEVQNNGSLTASLSSTLASDQVRKIVIAFFRIFCPLQVLLLLLYLSLLFSLIFITFSFIKSCKLIVIKPVTIKIKCYKGIG